jgi:hypothetical protein
MSCWLASSRRLSGHQVDRLAAVIDVQRLRLFASDKHLQEIGQLRIAVLRYQACDGEAASPSARSAYDVQERRFDVGERPGAVAGHWREPTKGTFGKLMA